MPTTSQVQVKGDNRKTALYCRLAVADHDTVKIQQMNLQNFAIQNGYEDFTLYVDNGYNGNNLDRPAFSQMDADITAGKIGTVIVHNICRIGRNLI